MNAMLALVFFALFQTPPHAAEALRSGCATDDAQVAFASAADQIQVEMAMAGEGRTCYRVVLTKPGGMPVTGYVLGEGLPAVAAFVRRREAASEAASKADVELAPPASKSRGEQAAPVDPLVSTQFEEFAAKDMRGKLVSLSGLRGKVTVVSFWSPAHVKTMQQVTRATPLYGEYHDAGLAVIGVSMDPNVSRAQETLDDITLPFPQVADRSGLAARYNVDPTAGKVFVLDASHRIIAAGPMGPEIEKAVRQALGVADAK